MKVKVSLNIDCGVRMKEKINLNIYSRVSIKVKLVQILTANAYG
jgi:hypothetical protein